MGRGLRRQERLRVWQRCPRCARRQSMGRQAFPRRVPSGRAPRSRRPRPAREASRRGGDRHPGGINPSPPCPPPAGAFSIPVAAPTRTVRLPWTGKRACPQLISPSPRRITSATSWAGPSRVEHGTSSRGDPGQVSFTSWASVSRCHARLVKSRMITEMSLSCAAHRPRGGCWPRRSGLLYAEGPAAMCRPGEAGTGPWTRALGQR